VATFSGLMITVRRERAGEEPAYPGPPFALSPSRVAPSISRNPPCRFYRLEIYYTVGPLRRGHPAREGFSRSLFLSRRNASVDDAIRSIRQYATHLPLLHPRGRDPFDRSVFLVTAGQSSFRRLTSMDRTRPIHGG